MAGDLAERLFGLSSLLTPFFMGTVVGAIASGRVPPGNAAGDPVSSWLNLLSVLIGAMFVATSAYVSAVFLVSDARRAGAADLERYFTVRALGAALVAGALAVAGIVDLRADAPLPLRPASPPEGLPLVIVSALCGLGGARAPAPRRRPRRARARGRRGRRRDLGLGRRPVPLPAARDAHDRRRRRARARPSPAC